MIASWIILVFGIVLSTLYLYWDRIQETKPADSSKKPNCKPDLVFGSEVEIDTFRLQYEQISASIHSRDNTTIVGGTIMITASVLLLTGILSASQEKEVLDPTLKLAFVLAALAIYSIWLMCFDLTSDRINNICYSILRQMECASESIVNVHSQVKEKVEQDKLYKFLRRNTWLALFWVLILLSVAILQSS